MRYDAGKGEGVAHEAGLKDARGGYVLAFESTHAAMAADKALAGTGALLMPTPTAISAGCGMSLRLGAVSEQEAVSAGESVPEARGLMALYRVDSEGGYALVSKL